MTSQELAEFLSGCSMEYKSIEAQRELPTATPTREVYLNGFVDFAVNQWAIEEYGRADFKHCNPILPANHDDE